MTTSYLGAGAPRRAASRAAENELNLALLGYALLFAAIFFAGLPALVAVVIAYAHRGDAPRPLKRHFEAQIRIFWVAFALTLAAAACALAGMVAGLGAILDVAAVRGFDRFGQLTISLKDVTIDARIVALLAGAVVLGFLSSLWLLAASSVGFVRLASEPGIGHSGRR